MKVYISGRIKGLPPFYSQMRFAQVERKLSDSGHEAVNPWKLDSSDCKEWDDYLMRDLEVLKECDAIYMLSNWQESEGAQVEYHFARGRNMYIMHEPSCLQCCNFDHVRKYCNHLCFIGLGESDKCEDFSRNVK